MMEYDIIILGLGPAGTSVAREFINSKYDVLAIDNSRSVSSVLMTFIDGIDKGMEDAILTRYDSYSEQNQSVNITVKLKGKTRLVIVDLKKMKQLIRSKIDFDIADAEIKKFSRENNRIILTDSKKKRYSAKLVIDCSGSNSPLTKPFAQKDEVSYYGYARIADNCRIKNKNMIINFNSPDYTNNGIWIYPLTKKSAQIGIFEQVYSDPDPKIMHKRLMKAISEIKNLNEILSNCKVNRKNYDSHRYPIKLRKLVDDNIIFVGNSGGQATPFMGECFRQSTMLGKVAARVAKKAVDNGRFSKRHLSEYSRAWKKMVGKNYLAGTLARDILIRLSEEELKEFTETVRKRLSDDDFTKVIRSELTVPLLLKCITPKILWYLLHHLFNPLKKKVSQAPLRQR